ncbi:hypothetical protein BC939DRAFT_527773 [Gamsiella multidivaricata]|uniref:uncharacterized protein n=1 Tax=Gamsiella multidivaricata TaxID=101098 RepID=UPI00221EF19D|nr:uncharacterized protein BC939DRAFT_527773 [Gamsiella multidivaricata]KAI7826231.1 hypothetical protein BC939DRAFT_527773 [Gamsiella multidivaricata]
MASETPSLIQPDETPLSPDEFFRTTIPFIRQLPRQLQQSLDEVRNQAQDGEASEFIDVDEGPEEERHYVEDEEDEDKEALEQQEDQGQQEKGDELPSTSNKSRKVSLKSLLDRIKDLNETARLSVEMKEVRQKELEIKKARDILYNNVERKKIEMVREKKKNEHERRLAEIQVDKELAGKREELRLQAQRKMVRDMERKRREIDDRLDKLY